MIASNLTPSNITFAIGIIGIIFASYRFLTDPQIKLSKNESLMQQQLGQLAKDLANLRDNHVHTLDTKVDAITESVNQLAITVAKLSTVIEERIPRKVV